MFNLGLLNQNEADTSVLYDVIIIGAGSAGFTCAIYTARDGWKTLILEKATSGGLIATTHLVENYPGFPDGIEGAELMRKFQAQALRFGAELTEFEEVSNIELHKDEPGVSGTVFHIKTNTGKLYKGRTILIATGSQPKKLGIPGEAEYYARGVSYCATCDGPLYKNLDTVVVGAGNSGLQESEILLKFAKSVTFVEFLPYSIAEKVLQDRVFSHPKTKVLFNHVMTEIMGGKTVTSIMVKNKDNADLSEISTSAVFIYVGYQPNTGFVKNILKTNRSGYIITDEKMATSIPGIYAAGDVRANNLAQAAVATGDGAKAAREIRDYLQKQKKDDAQA